MTVTLASRMQHMKASEIRELLKLTERPEVISFAGGLPAPEFFPVEEMKSISLEVLDRAGRKALQYSTTEGHAPLRQKIAERMNRTQGTSVGADNILVITGSQQGADLTGKLFLDEGDVVLCESPTYLGAINALRAYGPRFVEVPTDDDGMLIPDLEKALAAHPNAKLLYVIPDFQNPSGRCWSLERRQGLMELARKHQLPVVEDSPYRDLCFEASSLPSLMSLDRDNLVIHLGTFSKTFCPGLRLGWVTAPKGLYEKYVLLKQGVDLHSSTMSQLLLDRYLERHDIEQNIARITAAYRARRDVMHAAMTREFPAGVRFNRPQGGLFLWVELPEGIDSRDVLAAAIQRDVAFVPGGCFFPNGGHHHTMRVNYSNMPEDRIEEGVRRLGSVIRSFLR